MRLRLFQFILAMLPIAALSGCVGTMIQTKTAVAPNYIGHPSHLLIVAKLGTTLTANEELAFQDALLNNLYRCGVPMELRGLYPITLGPDAPLGAFHPDATLAIDLAQRTDVIRGSARRIRGAIYRLTFTDKSLNKAVWNANLSFRKRHRDDAGEAIAAEILTQMVKDKILPAECVPGWHPAS